MEASRPISVVLADDEQDIVEYLRVVLELQGFEVLGTAGDADGVIALVEDLAPDVAMLDLRMPGGGVEAARTIAAVSPDTHVIVFSGDAAEASVLPLMRAGIDGYVVKGAPPEQLADAIRSAVLGGAYFAPEVGRIAVEELNTRLRAEEQELFEQGVLRDRILAVMDGSTYRAVHQRIIDLRTGSPSGVEALTRFSGPPDRAPDAWFDEAEAVDERIALELATAARALAALNKLQHDLYMTVNISPATAMSGRLGEIFEDVDLSRVVVEVTEHAAVADYPALTAMLHPWREQGARLAVDDAGGGYASFAHILNLSPDFIKLDISLIREIDVDPHRQALARAIAGFANELGVSVVAEGVETAAELEVIIDLGTALAQGFHLGRPMPLEEQPELLEVLPAS
ncbi:MAG: EAL domain-containing protein [Actinomycetota bacterium]